MIRIRRTATIKCLDTHQLIRLAEWLELNEIEYEVKQSRRYGNYYDVTVPRCDTSAVLVVLAGCKKETR